MKTVLLLVHDDAGQEARLQAALDLTRALDGHLTCVDVTPTVDFAGDIGGAAQAMVLEAERKVEAANRVATETRLIHEGVAWDWIDVSGDFTACLLREAGLADLIVVNCKRDGLLVVEPRGIVSSVISRARSPVVAIPDNVRSFDVMGPALVAWDGSAPIMATLRASVPLLKLASTVRLFCAEDGAKGAPPQAAAAYLSRQGVHADIEVAPARGARPDGLILEACAAFGARYCVMGAYGHGRWAEDIFGGVTRRMLEAEQLPLVMGR